MLFAGASVWVAAALSGSHNRTVFIGDVHGCLHELSQMLGKLQLRRRRGDRVIFLGDVIAKGPFPLETFRLVKKTIASISGELLLGNHEASLLRYFDQRDAGLPAANRHGVGEGNLAIAEALSQIEIQWLRSRPRVLPIPELGIIAVHAGLRAGIPLAKQRPQDLAAMRSLDDTGAPSSRAGNTSWALSWRGPQHVIFGHDAKRRLQRYEFATGIDTGCVYGGSLTALVVPGYALLHVPAKRAYCSPHANVSMKLQHPNCARAPKRRKMLGFMANYTRWLRLKPENKSIALFNVRLP
mmetsp:Transcript_8388/g.16572  ORF Transcript_8388/g.16572 Transcript_8388/m.16572 type:complete len:297 (-) Transcript_8388:15-905(-)|eukprot:5334740-Pleurochrysis_carterae.AAC.1